MTPSAVLVDCDPGHDDVLAILTAARYAELIGITTVAGNAALEHTTRNALVTCELAGIDVAVHAGAAGPISGPTRDAVHVHGETGLAGVDIPTPRRVADGDDGPGFIVETARARPGVWIVAVGPLTNVALAIQRAPDLLEHIAGIAIMGGGTFGNATAAAEFNIWADPEAASRVFTSGIDVTMIGLDVTHKALFRPADSERLAKTGRVGKLVSELFGFYQQFHSEQYGWDGSPVHDAVAVAHVVRPGLVQTADRGVIVDCGGELSRGRTYVDLWGRAGWEPNCHVAVGVDGEAFLELLVERISALG
jgi:inosine-uridine nucleoside N-ribohydrolase